MNIGIIPDATFVLQYVKNSDIMSSVYVGQFFFMGKPFLIAQNAFYDLKELRFGLVLLVLPFNKTIKIHVESRAGSILTVLKEVCH